MARITVEDCLENVSNRFSLVILAAKRAKQILGGSSALNEDQRDNKAVVTALREIAEHKVRFASDEEMAAIEQAKIEALEAEQAAIAASRAPTGDSLFGASNAEVVDAVAQSEEASAPSAEIESSALEQE